MLVTQRVRPDSANHVMNGPPPGTPVASNGQTGHYEQGGPVPVTTPLTPGTGGTPGTFSASFTPKGNEWWVETSVSSNAEIAGVSVSLNGGAPVALTATSWGTWAKSIHAPAGSAVEFRARDAAGHAVVSHRYAWPPA